MQNASANTIIENVNYLVLDMNWSYLRNLLKSRALLTVVQYESGKQAKADGR